MRRLAFIISIGFLLSACSKEPDTVAPVTPTQERETVASIPAPTLKAADQIAKNPEILCNDSCEAAVALLTGTRLTEIGASAFACTATLVAPDLMLTASHCIPDDLRLGLKACGERLQFHFPYEAAIPCKEIVLATPPVNAHGLAADLALVRLQHSAASKPLSLSQEGVSAGTYRFVRMDTATPNQAFLAEQKSENCEASPDSVFDPSYTNPKSQVVSLGGCTAILGNSGGPLVAQDGTVRAAFHALSFIMDERAGKVFRALVGLSDSKPLPQILYATNLSSLGLSPAGFTVESPPKPVNPLSLLVSPPAEKENELRQKAFSLLAPALQTTHFGITEVAKESLLVRRFAPQMSCDVPIPSPTQLVRVEPRLNALYQPSYELSLIDWDPALTSLDCTK